MALAFYSLKRAGMHLRMANGGSSLMHVWIGMAH